jgi:hypothetical protein
MSIVAKNLEAYQRKARHLAVELEENMMTPADLYRSEADEDLDSFLTRSVGLPYEDELTKLCAQAVIVAAELKRDEEGEA